MSELTERAVRGDHLWMKHELAKLQFLTRGTITDTIEGRLGLAEESIIKDLLRKM